MKPRQPAD